MAPKIIDTLDVTLVRKTIDLPQWVVDDFDEMANIKHNKFKRIVELTLIEMATKFREEKKKLKA